MKDRSFILYFVFLFFVIGGVAFYWIYVDDGVPNVDIVTKDAHKFHAEYTSVPEENVFVYKDEDFVIDALKNSSGILYLGFPECPWCQAYVVYLNEVAKENNISEIYYLNIKDIRTNNTENYQTLVGLLGEILMTDDNGNKRIYVPQVVFFKDGKVIAGDNETSTISGGTPASYWTDAMVSSLKDRLNGYVEQAGLNVCTSCN